MTRESGESVLSARFDDDDDDDDDDKLHLDDDDEFTLYKDNRDNA